LILKKKGSKEEFVCERRKRKADTTVFLISYTQEHQVNSRLAQHFQLKRVSIST